MTINRSQVAPRSFSSKKLAMIAAANILRIGTGLASATSANRRAGSRFLSNRRPSNGGGTRETSADTGRRRAARLRMGLIAAERLPLTVLRTAIHRIWPRLDVAARSFLV